MNTPAFRLRTPIVVSLLVFAGGATEMLKNTLVALAFGAGSDTDAYFAAYLLPSTFSMFWVSACMVGFVPILASDREDSEFARTRLESLLFVSVALMTAVTVIVTLIAGPIASLIVPGYTFDEKQLVAKELRLLSPLFISVGLSGVCSAALNARGRFYLASANKILINLLIVSGLVWALRAPPPLNIDILSFLVSASAAVYAAIVLVHVYRSGYIRSLTWRRVSQYLGVAQPFIGACILPFVALSARQTSAFADRAFASWLTDGSVSALNYAYQATMGVSTILCSGISTVMISTLARARLAPARLTLLWTGLMYTIAVLIPATAFAWAFADPIARLLFFRGAFSTSGLVMTTSAFRGYAIGMLFSGIAAHLQTMYWAERRYTTMILHNTLVAVVNVLAAAVLVDRFGVGGLAFAFSFASVFSVGRLVWLVKRDYATTLPMGQAVGLVKLAIGGALLAGVMRAVVAASGLDSPVSTNSARLIALPVAAVIGSAVYLLAGRVAAVEPFPEIVSSLRQSGRHFLSLLGFAPN